MQQCANVQRYNPIGVCHGKEKKEMNFGKYFNRKTAESCSVRRESYAQMEDKRRVFQLKDACL